MEIYLFKHKKSKSAYIRLVRNVSRIPKGGSRLTWLFGCLHTTLSPKTYRTGAKKQIHEHLLKHKLLTWRDELTGKLVNPDWRSEWGIALHAVVSQEDVDQVGSELVSTLIKEGWFILNGSVRWTRKLDTTIQQANKVFEPAS